MRSQGYRSSLLLRTLLALAFVVAVAPLGASATPIFEESFDAEPGLGDGASGGSGIGYDAFAQWTVSDGTVDLVADGDFGIRCLGEAGKCVDLDGATFDAGTLTSTALSVDPGTYRLEFWLAGTASVFTGDAAATPNVVDVSVSDLFSTSITRDQGDPFARFVGVFEVTAAREIQIQFDNQGGDQFGAMLDDVQLALVPAPASSVLVVFGGASVPVFRILALRHRRAGGSRFARAR